MKKFQVLLLLARLLSVVKCQEVFSECSSIGCVHASAKLLSRISHTKPCDDFYEFSCGAFLRNTYTPDEKTAVNTESLLSDQLDEHLFRLFSKPVDVGESRPHAFAKRFYQNCMNLDRIKELQSKQLLELLDNLGGWPVLVSDWNEDGWTAERTLLLLHRIVGVGDGTNVFRNGTPDGLQDGEDSGKEQIISRIKRSAIDGNEENLLNKYKEYMFDAAISLGAEATEITKQELEKALELGLALTALLDGSKFQRRSGVKSDEQKSLRVELDVFRWLELFDRFKVKSIGSLRIDYSKSVYDNFKNLKKLYPRRVFANYVLWRFVDFASQFLHDEAQENIFKLLRQTYGVLDKDQRWKLCTRMTNTYAAVASGSLYVREYFPQESRRAALEMVENIIDEFRRTVQTSDWMDNQTKLGVLQQVDDLQVFIGYDERLLSIEEVEKFYGKPSKNVTESFLYMGLQLNVQIADKTFLHKYRKQPDWTLNSKPTSTRASYNRKDNSMFFAAAFLQPPNFDKDRPASMNFGAIGSVIAHELTHCFDRFTQNIQSWPASSIELYGAKLECIVEQYDGFVDPDLTMNLNGTVTIGEDTADNGGIKLAYRAYAKWLSDVKPVQSRLIALDFTPEQLFWISYAQFYCTVQRKEHKYQQLTTHDPHSFDRFRVLGPLMNSPDFARAFNCPISSAMNPNRARCAIW